LECCPIRLKHKISIRPSETSARALLIKVILKNIIIKYCIQNADKVAQGYDVIQDLVKSGLVSNSSFGGKTCPQVQAEHERDKIRQDFETIDPLRNTLGNRTADR